MESIDGVPEDCHLQVTHTGINIHISSVACSLIIAMLLFCVSVLVSLYKYMNMHDIYADVINGWVHATLNPP